MRVLRVKISSRLAHFRKVFSNSTSLSYYFPPRTTVVGILAAAMGLERDSYYESFSPDALEVGVEAVTPLRKLTFSETYLDTDDISVRKLRGLAKRVPVTREFVAPAEGEFLSYYFYFYPSKEDYKKAFSTPAYPISLGPANMLSWVEEVSELECKEVDDFSGKTSVRGAVPAEFVIAVSNGAELVIEEGVPRMFGKGRRSGQLANYYFSVNAQPFSVKEGRARGLECADRAVVFL